jgi:hypothetical protein
MMERGIYERGREGGITPVELLLAAILIEALRRTGPSAALFWGLLLLVVVVLT